MTKVLVDANKYLEFYQATPSGPLVPLLAALGDNLLIPKQIVYEVQRNKVSLSQSLLSQSWPKKSLQYSYPSHLMSFDMTKLDDINQRMKEINNRSTAIQRDLNAAFATTVADIANGRDPVSIQLAPLFAKAIDPTPEELAKARLRKEIGNPPGKRTDPLGDQVTWEQFLSRINGEPLLWIITGDGDYRYEMPDKIFVLNPILRDDVNRVSGIETEVRCFATLADGLKDALDTLALQPEKQLSREEIADIRQSELESAARSKTPSVVCPTCGGATSWHALQAVQGYHGGIVFFICPLCGAKFDTE